MESLQGKRGQAEIPSFLPPRYEKLIRPSEKEAKNPYSKKTKSETESRKKETSLVLVRYWNGPSNVSFMEGSMDVVWVLVVFFCQEG